MDSYNIYFNLHEVKKVNKVYFYIMAFVAWNGKRVRATIKPNIKKEIWDFDKQRAKGSTMNPRKINDKLDQIRFVLKNFYDETYKELKRAPTVRETKPVLDAIIHNREIKKRKPKEPKKPKTFMEYFQEFIDDTRAGIRLSSGKKRIQSSSITSYVTTQNHLLEFLKGMKNEITFNDIDDEFNSALIKYLSKKKLSNNSQGKLIKNIKSFMHYYFDKGIHDNRKFIKILKVFDEPTTKIALTQAELEEIENLKDLSLKHEKYRNLFLAQIYSGMRFSDLINLKPQNINYDEKIITIYTVKTQDPVIIPMTNKLMSILKKYNGSFPKISSQKYNDGIKEICEKAKMLQPIQITYYIGTKRKDKTIPKFKLVSSHTARRTFITLSLKKGVMEDMVMQVSGHKSKKSFQRYIRIAQNEAISEVRKAWEE